MFHEVISNLESFVSKAKATSNATSKEIATAIVLTGEDKEGQNSP